MSNFTDLTSSGSSFTDISASAVVSGGISAGQAIGLLLALTYAIDQPGVTITSTTQFSDESGIVSNFTDFKRIGTTIYDDVNVMYDQIDILYDGATTSAFSDVTGSTVNFTDFNG